MTRAFMNLLILAIAAAIIGFFAAPGVAFFALRSAAQASDTHGLAQLIDYGAVRQSLRPQLEGRPEAQVPPPSFLDDPIGAVRRQLEGAAGRAAPDVNAYLTPAALSGLTRGEGRYAAQRSGLDAPPVEQAREPWPRPRHWGVNRARMAVADEGGSETIFTFERKGPYRWVLVHIGLPDGATPLIAPAPTDEADQSAD